MRERQGKLNGTGNAQVSGGPHVRRGVFGMLGQRRGTTGWGDDYVKQHNGRQCMMRRVRSGLTPWTDIGRKEEGARRVYI